MDQSLTVGSSSVCGSKEVAPKFATIEMWTVMSGMTRRHTYNELGLGNLRAVKLGKRTLIDVEAGLAWIACCPAGKDQPAKI